jgi:hypothetical protein
MSSSLHSVRLTLCLAAVAALGPGAAVASAQPVRVTGETTVALSPAATQALTNAGVAVAPLAPATATSTGISFPVAFGRVNLAADRGFLLHRGGVSLTKGGKTVRLLRPVVRVTGAGAFLSVRVAHRTCHLRKIVRFVVRKVNHGRHHVRRKLVRYVRHHCLHRHGFRVRAFTLGNLNASEQNGTIVATASLALTQRAANLLNRAFGTSFAAGAAAGTATATLTVVPQHR